MQDDIHYTTTPPYYGSEEERKRRLEELQAVAKKERDWADLFHHDSWEHPVDIALALHRGDTQSVDILNVRNRGAIRQLPDERIVEVPVLISNGV
ncbi:hypothetical protein [Paenibacillus sp. Soil724D2]|uniref:family 4 glycosyl hydrolase n=1 Tax=Paenibacillus sp. (strain Soil724D2) TaxID=1736392 RepID=UPI0007160C08|nr:hypothetical protein [Paenibacillus sp. Soil724D2]KRE34299.1 hypothetical protein ASG85_13115 [Paenibacillus sp. Soil724D2]